MALPLVIAAVVCLLATSGVWLFRGGDSGKDKTPIGLNVPTVVAPQPEPTPAPATDGTSPSATPEATETATASASAKPTTKAPTTKPPSTTAKPPSSAPPPATTAAPKPYAASVSAEAGRYGGVVTITVTVSNPNNVPLGPWTIRLSGRRLSSLQLISSPPGVQGSDEGAEGTGPVAGGGSVRLLFTMRFRGDPPPTLKVDFNGTSSDVDIESYPPW